MNFLPFIFADLHPMLSTPLQILLLAICIYILLRIFRHTSSIYAFSTLIALALFLALLAHLFQRSVLGALCWYLLKGLPLATIIVMQQDLRRLFLQISTVLNPQRWKMLKRRNQSRRNHENATMIDALVKTVCCLTTLPAWRHYLRNYDDELSFTPHLPKKNIGALIALQGNQGLLQVIEQGVSLDSRFDHEHPASFPLLLLTLFHPGTPLHDGGVILSNHFRILAAGCQFPQSQARMRGPVHTRHNAALGLSQNTDALVIVVSEESGNISVASQGTLRTIRNPDDLTKLLSERFNLTQASPSDEPSAIKK
ncbi:MAG: diadenylate cyclase [Victivallales bacterium]|nr:diadenylate cyclase [Victivallales bacterium]